jgi:hypothetical protein
VKQGAIIAFSVLLAILVDFAFERRNATDEGKPRPVRMDVVQANDFALILRN